MALAEVDKTGFYLSFGVEAEVKSQKRWGHPEDVKFDLPWWISLQVVEHIGELVQNT